LSSIPAEDLAPLILRVALGVVFIAHGWNHVFGGGRIAGTARWFESLGMRPGLVHAVIASAIELGAGLLLLCGFLTPLACAGVVGTMAVAWVANHLRNGFFIFRPGEGYEYVMTLTLAAVALSGVGPGGWSVDQAAGWFAADGWLNLILTVALGFGGAAVLLAACWRPGTASSSTSGEQAEAAKVG
jgi:putative oxidoreductase